MKNYFLILCFLFLSVSYSQNTVSFVQKDNNKIIVSLKSHLDSNGDEETQTVEIVNQKTGKKQIITGIETSITGKKSKLELNDYNFDGFTDFACFHTDDGMGVYTIWQIYIFNPKTKKFEILKFPSNYNPKCDMFCDVKIDITKKILTSSCRGGARTHTDFWKYNANKNLILLKTESY